MFIGVEFVVSIIFVFCGECIVYDEGYGGARGNLVTNPLDDVFTTSSFAIIFTSFPCIAERGRWERG